MGPKGDGKKYPEFLLVLAAICALVFGLTLILAWWDAVVVFFKGGLGILCTLVGFFILYTIQSRR